MAQTGFVFDFRDRRLSWQGHGQLTSTCFIPFDAPGDDKEMLWANSTGYLYQLEGSTTGDITGTTAITATYQTGITGFQRGNEIISLRFITVTYAMTGGSTESLRLYITPYYSGVAGTAFDTYLYNAGTGDTNTQRISLPSGLDGDKFEIKLVLGTKLKNDIKVYSLRLEWYPVRAG